MEYKIVEVDPIFKKEIKFSEYRKVPIVVIQDIQVGHVTRTCSPFLFNCWLIDDQLIVTKSYGQCYGGFSAEVCEISPHNSDFYNFFDELL
jgi:hypothetical protein